ncbi:MAG: pyrroline-5-carboxylate reductase [Clostridia bacterium]|nr:pyrroline-5-carboxylate reductase [Clostridia bacterium]
MKNIGFIGCGNMASTMIGGILKTCYDPAKINVFDIDAAKADAFGKRGVSVRADELDVAKNSDFVVLAVKPQVMKPLLEKLGACNENAVYVSIAAGVSVASVKRFLGYDAKVVRVMPNTSLLMGLGATAVSHSAPVSGEEFEFVKTLFASSGIVEEVGEDMMNSVISVNGSSPAYVYYLAKAVADGAEKQGIDRDTALRLFAKVLEGSAKMLTDSGITPEELIDRVCSKGGTTIEAVNVLDARGVHDAVIEGMEACTRRAEELDLK